MVIKGKNRVPADTIPEVVDLLEFEKRHKDELEKIRPVLEIRESLLQAAEKAVRAKCVSCDRFNLLTEVELVDWSTLFEELGVDKFLDLVGGEIKQVPKYIGDKAMYKVACAKGDIPEEIDAKVRKTQRRYSVKG